MSNVYKARILVVEDSEFSRAMIMGALKNMGFNEVEYPETSIEAWEKIADSHLNGNPYDLVITDLNMPGFDGIDLISQIKGDPMSASQKIIVITADADPGIKLICKELGVLAYFTKPFKRASLEEVVLAILNNKEEIPAVEDLI